MSIRIPVAEAVKATEHLVTKRFTFAFEDEDNRTSTWSPWEPSLQFDRNRGMSYSDYPPEFMRAHQDSPRGWEAYNMEQGIRKGHTPALWTRIHATVNGVEYSGTLHTRPNPSPHNPGIYTETSVTRVTEDWAQRDNVSAAATSALGRVGNALWVLVTPERVDQAWAVQVNSWAADVRVQAVKWAKLADFATTQMVV